MNNDHLHTLLSTKNKIHNTQKGHFLKYFYLESVLTFAKLFSLSTSSTNEYIVIFQHISICHLQQICNKLLFFCCLQTPKRPFYKASRTPYLSRLFIVGNTQEDKVLFHIIRYYPIFAAFSKRIIRYYSVPCKQNS